MRHAFPPSRWCYWLVGAMAGSAVLYAAVTAGLAPPGGKGDLDINPRVFPLRSLVSAPADALARLSPAFFDNFLWYGLVLQCFWALLGAAAGEGLWRLVGWLGTRTGG